MVSEDLGRHAQSTNQGLARSLATTSLPAAALRKTVVRLVVPC